MDLLFFAAIAFIIGTLLGSFMNVCLTRWPAGESIVRPGSHCRNCAHTLSWWENIPILSWLFLRGRCHQCKTSIGWRYPLVELLCGIFFAAAILTAPILPYSPPILEPPPLYFPLLATAVYSWLVLALAFLDAENFWLPDLLTIPGIALGLFFRHFGDLLFLRHDMRHAIRSIAISLLEIAAAALLILLIRWVYFLVRHEEGMGLGDAKLMAMLGAWLGWQRALLTFTLAIFLATAFATVLLLRGKPDENESPAQPAWARTMLPFGTFLCIGGMASYFFGGQLIAYYLRAVGL